MEFIREWLAKILTSSNAITLVILGIIIIVLLGFMAKIGIIRFSTDKLSIGYQDKERTIIRQQIEFTQNACMSFIIQQNIPEECDKYRLWFVNEKIYDEMINWISFNHITTDDTYIEIKQNIVLGIIATYTQKDYFKSDDFKEMCNKEVKRIIHKLVDIRKYYSK